MDSTRRPTALFLLPLLLAALAGCDSDPAKPPAPKKPVAPPAVRVEPAPTPSVPEQKPAVAVEPAPPAPKDEGPRKQLGRGVWLEIGEKHRRVWVAATVCLREGSYGLECLLCRKNTKEHESILTTDADASIIHAALLAAGAEPGSPVQYQPKFKSPTGQTIRVLLQYEPEKGKAARVPARNWVRNVKTRKDLDADWVFAGSRLYPNQDDESKPPVYAANSEGGYICISNVMTALLDLPFNSPKSLEDRVFEPHTERIPALDTAVMIILEPVPEKKKE